MQATGSSSSLHQVRVETSEAFGSRCHGRCSSMKQKSVWSSFLGRQSFRNWFSLDPRGSPSGGFSLPSFPQVLLCLPAGEELSKCQGYPHGGRGPTDGKM